jgi:hypothetical protein
MKDVFKSLFWTLLSVVTLALLFPATRMMIDSGVAFWPGIHSDINLGALALHKEMVQFLRDLLAIARTIPWPFWTFFVIYFFATKKETKTSPRQWRQWYKKWNGVLWPIYLSTLCIWTAGQSPDADLFIVVIFLVFASALLYFAFRAYKAAKEGRQFWMGRSVPHAD